MNKYIIISIVILTASLLLSCKDTPTNHKKPDDTLFVPVPNFTFEEWTTTYNDKNEYMYEEPKGGFWTTTNRLRLLGGPVTTEKSTDAYAGQYAARMETKQFGTLIINGMVLAGEFNPDKYPNKPNFINTGQPFTGKPVRLKGYYKYQGVDRDSGSVFFAMTKWNTQLKKTDTIAECWRVLGNTSTWDSFDIALNYYYPDVDPDSIRIAVISSTQGRYFTDPENTRVGSVMYVDELSMEMPGGKIIKLDSWGR
ncbi:MAG: PCMD domain-containing protein [bacterium]